MNGPRNFLCSYILDIINNKPLQSENVDKLLTDLRTTLKREGIVVPHLKEEVEASIQNCMSLGILKLTNEQICLPFRLKSCDSLNVRSRNTEKTKPAKVLLQPGLGRSRKSINAERNRLRKKSKYMENLKSKSKKLTYKRGRQRRLGNPTKS